MLKLCCGLLTFIALTANAFANDAVRARLDAMKPKDFPTQPLEFIVVYPAGGGMDVIARQVARSFEKVTGQRAIVTNRTGGAGLVGHTWFVSAPNTGYVVGILSNNFWTDSIQRSNGAWSINNIDPIAFINSDPITWYVSTSGPFAKKSLKDILTDCGADGIRVATSPGGTSEIAADIAQRNFKCTMRKVPFQGSGPTITAILGGHIDIGYGFLPEFKSYRDAGQIVPVAVASAKRSEHLPDIPTFNETLGTDIVILQAWRFVALPVGVPADRKAWLAAAFEAAIADPEVQAEFKRLGASVDPTLNTSAIVKAKVEELAESERKLLKQTGRIP
jgi:tripartite-type tricarboxylate transporter receptor subunit TctC